MDAEHLNAALGAQFSTTPEKLRAFVKSGAAITILTAQEGKDLLRRLAVPTEEQAVLEAKAKMADEIAAQLREDHDCGNYDEWLRRYTILEKDPT